jgi:hypothetical protein
VRIPSVCHHRLQRAPARIDTAVRLRCPEHPSLKHLDRSDGVVARDTIRVQLRERLQQMTALVQQQLDPLHVVETVHTAAPDRLLNLHRRPLEGAACAMGMPTPAAMVAADPSTP